MKVLYLIILFCFTYELTSKGGWAGKCPPGCKFTSNGCSCYTKKPKSHCKGPWAGLCPCGCRVNFNRKKGSGFCDCPKPEKSTTYTGPWLKKFPLNKNEKKIN